MNDAMLQRVLALFEEQSKSAMRVTGFFVLAVVFLQLIFIRLSGIISS